jgi:hypothetical protein
MKREALIREIQRALKEQTGSDCPINFNELSNRTLEGLALLLSELDGQSQAAVRRACDSFLQEAKDQVCLCFGPPVDDCPIHGSRTTK